MNYTQLSLDQTPELWAPLRFFISAPVFAIAAIVLMLVSGPEVYQNRWLPETIAITHLITLGFISMVMLGAAFQLLPVLAGCTVYKSAGSSKLVYFLFTSGVVFFTGGLVFSNALVIKAGLFFLVPGLLIFLILVSFSLYRTSSGLASATGIRFAIFSLWLVLILGAVLGVGTAWTGVSLLRELTSLHITWGAFGWITIMVVSIAYQVIPMFQVTQEYPDWFKKYFVVLLMLSLFVISVLKVAGYSQVAMLVLISALMIGFVLYSTKLLLQRKKRLADAGLYFWLTGLGALALSVFVFNYAYYSGVDLSVYIGFIFLGGFVYSIINGMLFKIVPFLVWLHLNKKRAFKGGSLSSVPTMNEVISRKKMLRQYYLHILALLFTLFSFFVPDIFFYPAMILWLFSLSVLFLYLLQSVQIYYRCLNAND